MRLTRRTGSVGRAQPNRLRYVALLAAVAMIAAACGGDEADEDTGDDDEAAADDDAEDDADTDTGDDGDEEADDGDGDEGGGDVEGAELTVWFAREYFVPPEEHITRFEDETGISVTTDVQPDDDLFQQLIRMDDAGQELPDIVHLDGFLRPAVADAGVVVPIQDVVDQWAEEDPESYDMVTDAVWEEGMWNDELVGMANSASMEEVFVRTDWLEAGGGEMPDTWDGVLDAARAIQEAEPDVTPFGWWATRGGGANAVYSSMTAMGVEFEGSKPILDSDGGQYWIEFIQTLAAEELLHPEAIAWSDDEMRGGFVGGTVGMMLDSVPTAGDAEDAGLALGENFEVVPMPTERSDGEGDGTITAPARTFHITSAGEENKEAAGLFLRFLMEADVAQDVMLLGGDPHRTEGVLGDEEFLSEEYPAWSDASIEAFSNAGVFPVDEDFFAAAEVMEQLNQYVVSNPDEDPAAVAEQWQAEFDALEEE